MRYIIVGGSGFVGQATVALLRGQGEEIVVVDKQPPLPHVTVFRPRMIIGKGRMGILAKLFKLIEHSLPVPMIGSGKNCYQMVAVQGCAAAIYQAVRHRLPNKAYNLGPENPPTVRDLLKQVIVGNHSKSIVVPTWAWAVKRTLDILGVIGVELMYKEQYMIADENYLIDISETKEDLGWNPRYNDVDMMMEAFRECRCKQGVKPSRLDESRIPITRKYDKVNTNEK